MEALHLFIPMDRRHALARAESLPEQAHGAVLFADISGFSLLTAALAQDLGPQRGAEALTRHLDRVVGALVGEVHRFRGSVIGFSGDGITCWFDDANLSVDACRRATACALAMQDVVAHLAPIATPGGTNIVVGIKVALASGSVRRLLVGDSASQLLEVLAGATLKRMADAANHAGRGEVVASREVVDRLGPDTVTIGGWRPSNEDRLFATLQSLREHVAELPWPAAADVPEEVAQSWAIAAVRERVALGRGEFLGEVRPVVAMFLHFTGIDYDNDARAGHKLDAYVRWVQATVARYEGTLLQLSVDDKGSHLYIAVGALQAHEDDALRAVAAARQLSTPPPELSFIGTSRLGISRGRMYAGAYGGPSRRTYTVLGHEVNVAARLMEAAAFGEILVSSQIQELVARQYGLDDRGALLLKGMNEPRRVFVVCDRRPLPEAHRGERGAGTRLIGRADESRHLDERLDELREGSSAAVIVEGSAGIGKSRLIGDFIGRARSQAFTAYVGTADSIERSAPYHAWRAVFADIFEGSAPAIHIIERRLTGLDANLVQRAPLLNAVLGRSLPDNALTAEMTGKVRADNTNDLLVGIFQAMARSAAMVVVLEDAHWMDSASWALVERVSREVAPLLLVIGTRALSQPWPDEYAALLQAPSTHLLRLDSLSEADTTALVCERLEASSVPQPVIDLVLRKASGHPFFSELILRGLQEAGLIQVRGGVCYLSPGTTLESLDSPDTVEGVITSRIDSLSSPEQLTLKVASVIGRTFDYTILRDCHPVERNEQTLAKHLDNLTEIEMLLHEPDMAYMFKHAITQEVAYGLLLYPQRSDLHRAVARWYESNAGESLAAHYPRLAHHWSRAARGEEAIDREAVAKALDYLEKAGEQALNSHANEEAILFFTEALDLYQRPGPGDGAAKDGAAASRCARWHCGLSLAYQGLGDLKRCREHAQQGLAFLDRPLPSGSAQFAIGILRQVMRRLIRRRAAPSLTGAEADLIRQAADLYIPLARVAFHTNDSLCALYVNTTKLNLMERLGPSPELAESYGSIGVTLGVFQLHARADSYVRRAVDVARSANHSGSLVAAHVISSVYLVGSGHWQRVREHLEEGRTICTERGDHQQWGDCMAIMADAALLEGDMTRALALYDELLEGARRRNNHLQELWAIRGKATAALRDAKANEAVGLLQHAQVLLEDTTDQATRIDMHGLLAAAHASLGEWGEADRSARAAATLIAANSPPTAYPQYLGYAGVAETFFELVRRSRRGEQLAGIGADVEKRATRALRDLHAYRRIFAIGGPQAWRYQGMYEQMSGNPKKAQRAWAKGLKSAIALRIPYEQGMLHYLIAGSMAATDPARPQHLQQAAASFAPLGSAHLIAMVETQLAEPAMS